MLKTLVRSWILLGYIPTKRGNLINSQHYIDKEQNCDSYRARRAAFLPTDWKSSVALAPMPLYFYIQPYTTRTPMKCCSRRLFLLITTPARARKLRKLRRDSLVRSRHSVLKILPRVYRKYLTSLLSGQATQNHIVGRIWMRRHDTFIESSTAKFYKQKMHKRTSQFKNSWNAEMSKNARWNV